MCKSVSELAALVEGRVLGDGALLIENVASLESARDDSIVFVESEKHLSKAAACAARCLIVPDGVTCASKTVIQVRNPRLAFARIVALFHPPEPFQRGVHPSAVIAPDVHLPEEVFVGPYAIIESGVPLGNRTHVGAHCFVGANTKVGEHCRLHPRVTIYGNVEIRNHVIIHSGAVIGSDGFGYVPDAGRYLKFPQVGKVLIEDEVEIGANTTIDRGALDATVIRRGTKIDNLVQVAHNVRIDEHVVVAAQTGISGSTVIEKHAVIGGQAGLADHVTIEEGAIVGAQAGVPTHKIIRKGQFVMGFPARPAKEFTEIYAHSARLPEWKEKVRALADRLERLEQDLAQKKQATKRKRRGTQKRRSTR